MADPRFSAQFPAAARPRSTRLTRRSQRIMARVSYLAILSLLNAGCSPWPTAPWQQNPPVELTMQAQSANQPGTYTLSGTTNLPDQSRILVQGIRDLRLPGQSSVDNTPNSYAILERQIVEVKQGKWHATLKLWQVAPDGTYQESWQLSAPPLATAPRPSSSVTFLALFDPATQPEPLKPKLRNVAKGLAGQSVRFTPEGEWYLEAKQTVMASLPSGQTSAPITLPVSPSPIDADPAPAQTSRQSAPPPLPQQSQSTAPLSPAEQLY
jgi:hypothetical protein